MEKRNTALAIGAGCVVLTLIFLLIGFPYDRLESRVVSAIEQTVGGRMDFAESERAFGFTGPAFEWRGVRISVSSERAIELDRLRTRLAWSSSWLRLSPAFYVELEGGGGNAAGVVSLGSRPGFDGRLERFDLAMLPADWTLAGVTVRGLADVELDVTGGEQWMGDVKLSVTGGSLSGKKFRSGMPFNELTGELRLAGDHRTEITSLHLDSPLLQVDISGSIGPAVDPGEAPLDLAVELDADVRATSLLRGFGIRLDKKGPQSLRVSGTVDAPKVR